MIKKYSTLGLLIALFGCSDNDTASYETAKAVITTSMSAEGDSTTNQLILQQPEVKVVIDCIASHLGSQGWTTDQHEAFIQQTGGDMKKVSSLKMTEEEKVSAFGPIYAATAECM